MNKDLNWLEERETIIKKAQREAGMEQRVGFGSWLDSITNKMFRKAYPKFEIPGYCGHPYSCVRLLNGDFGLFIKMNYTYFSGYVDVKFSEFGIIDEDGSLKTTYPFLQYINAMNAGRKINGKTYAQSYKEFATEQARAKFNKIINNVWASNDIVTDQAQEYDNEIKLIELWSNNLEEEANSIYLSLAQEQENAK